MNKYSHIKIYLYWVNKYYYVYRVTFFADLKKTKQNKKDKKKDRQPFPSFLSDPAYLSDNSAYSNCRGGWSLLPLQRSGLRLPVAAQSPAHAQAQYHIQHGHLGYHIPDCTRDR